MKKLFALMLALALALATLTVPAVAETAPKAGKVKTVITLSHKGTVTLNKGDTLQLTATVTPTATVKWKTGKAKIATVDANGLVRAVGEGTTTIKATAGKKSAKVKVKVVDPYKPTGVSINQGKSAKMNLGATLQLGATLKPSTAKASLTWKSSKAKVATVDGNGIVTAKAEGKAKITVTAGKKKASITITVVNPNKPTGISLNRSGTVTLPLNETLTIGASLQPATAVGTITWSTSNKKVATVSGGVVTPKKKGTVTITAKCGKKKAKVKVKVVGAEQHEHTWQDVTENRYVVDSPAWDETVVDSAAWDETVVDSQAWDETVVVKEAWTETVVDKEAWTESIPWAKCFDCGKKFSDVYDLENEGAAHLNANLKYKQEHGEWPPFSQDTCDHGSYSSMLEYIDHPAETHTVDHPAETQVVHHDAVTHVMHHDAVTHVVHHDEVGHWETVVVGHVCATCGAMN